jgi:hypothetical protein
MKTTTLLPFAILLSTLALAAQGKGGDEPAKTDKVDFEKQIWPILEKNCLECHSTAHTGPDGKLKKPKGGVIFDNKAAMQSGKKGKLIVAKNPGDSLMHHAITLPADDEDRMPPAKKGDPLPKEQQELIGRWIEQGADFGAWSGKKGKEGEKPKDGDKPKEGDAGKGKGGTGKEEAELAALAAGLAPVASDVLAPVAAVATIEPVAHDSPLLCVSFFGREGEVDDQVVASLAPLFAHIVELNLGRTKVTDGACAEIARMQRLRRLDLHSTAIGDAGVANLANCAELRSVNLNDTKVGDAGATALGRLPKLAAVYLWGTRATATAVAHLQGTLQGARVVMAAELPEPLPAEQQGQRRRR